MFMAVLLGTEMSLRFHGLPALWTDWTAARNNFRTPARKLADLFARAPKADSRGRFGIGIFTKQFLGKDDDAVAFFVVTEANFTHTKERVHGGMDAHDFFHVV